MIYKLLDYELIWDYEPSGSESLDASRLKDNNLSIKGLWNMKETVGFVDSCVKLVIISEDTFCFWTFNCMMYKMQIKGNQVVCLSKQLSK